MSDTPMTPTAEERAEDLWETTILCDLVPGKQSAADVIDVIAVAIRAAEQASVARELERCAAVIRALSEPENLGKPTIHELEEILAEADPPDLEILPSGEVASSRYSEIAERFATAIEAGEQEGE